MTATPCPYCSQPAFNWDGLGENADRIYRCGTVNSTRSLGCHIHEDVVTTEEADVAIAELNEATVWIALGHGPLASLSTDE